MNRLFLQSTTKIPLAIMTMAAAATLVFAIDLGNFYLMVESACEYSSYGDIEYFVQLWYNFSHGLPFIQSSYFENAGAGYPVNKYAYMNMFVIHATLTQSIISPLSRWFPDVEGLYSAHFLSLYGLSLLYGWKLCRLLANDRAEALQIFAVFILVLFLRPVFVCWKFAAQPLSLSAPLLLAAVYYLKSARLLPYFGMLLAVILTSEDATLVVAGIAVYVFLFEKKSLWYSTVPFALAVTWALFVVFVAQPAARLDMTTVQSSYAGATIYRVFSPDSPISIWHAQWWASELWGNLWAMRPAVLIFVIAFAPCVLTRAWRGMLPSLGLGFIGGGGYWAMSVVWRSVHHLSPLIGLGLALIVIELARTRLLSDCRARPHAAIALAAFLAAVCIGNLYLVRGVLVIEPYQLAADVAAGEWNLPRASASFEAHYARGCNRASDQEFRAVLRTIPRDKTISYLANPGLGAWMASRNGYWMYPSFYDRADYLMVQKDVQLKKTPYDRVPIDCVGSCLPGGGPESIPSDFVERLKSELAGRSHSIVYESPRVMLLARREQGAVAVPEHLIGFNFLFRRGG